MENTENFIIEIKKLDYLYENLLSGLIAILGLTTIIFFTFADLVESQNLNIWLILNILILLLRGFLLTSYKKTKITKENFFWYYSFFFILASLHALLWGSSALLILPKDIEYQMIILLLTAGLISGSAVSLSSKIEIFYVYMLLTMIPFVFVFYFDGSKASQVLSISMLLYIFILFMLAKKISSSTNNNIIYAYKNQNLILQLEDKVQEANIANIAKSKFLSVMSHEIRTPLNAIMGFVQILQKIEKDEKKQKYLDTIDRSSKVLANVINDILDITKIESGKFTLETTKFNPKDEFNSIYTLFAQNSLDKNVKLINSISPYLPKFLNTDILRIKQILSNLLSNAIKFTPQDKNIELIINFNEKKSLLYFEIRDEGIGISKENILNITEAFTQADNSTARKYGGTGLGLTIVTNLLKLFNSELKIESNLGKGSRFSFEILISLTS